MITGSSLAQVAAHSMGQGGPGAGGLIFEAFVLAAGTDHTLYGKGNTNAGADDCKFIQKFLGGYAMSNVDDNDMTTLIISADETADDLATISSDQSTLKYVLLWGVGAEGTPA